MNLKIQTQSIEKKTQIKISEINETIIVKISKDFK